MLKLRNRKSLLAVLLTVSMLFTGNAIAFADEEVSDSEAVVEQAAETTEAAEPSVEEVKDEEPEVVKEEEVSGRIEINQGFSYHVGKDFLAGEDPSFIKNFVACKKTAIMYSVKADNEEAAKEATKNWKFYYKKANDDGSDNGGEVVSWQPANDVFHYNVYYDKNSNVVSGNMMAFVVMPEGPDAGKYNFYLDDNGKTIAYLKDVDFFKAKPLNILAVPVKAYYSKSNNVKPDGSGGCPQNLVGQAVECTDEYWKNLGDKIGTKETKGKSAVELIKQYLLDVYPVAEVNIDEGNVFDGSSSDYDMCNDNGQKKLWEEVSKLQVRDKETGKDKYDIILAFVMYRQDESGTGQGYTFGKPTNIITLTDPDMLPTVAHEIAHCYGIGDEYDGGSYNYRTNNVPLNYKSKGRDKIDSSSVDDTTKYETDDGRPYNGKDTDKYPWFSSEQYKNTKLGDSDKVFNDKKKGDVNEDGKGSVIDLDLHPLILSKTEFVHFASKGSEVFPTISYMGSGYSGNENYYFTTSVIWDHLFNEFMEKKKKGESSSLSDVKDMEEGVDPYFEEEVRFGESRMIEVAGELKYTDSIETATVSSCIVDPMFSYNGDLELIDQLDLDGDDKDMKKKDLFVFAALDKDGKVITSPVDKEKSIVRFYGSNINTGINVAPISGNEKDKRIQDFCEFEFDAEYPKGTAAFAIINDENYKDDGVFKEGDKEVLWFKAVPPQEIDGEITDVKNTKSEMTVKWQCAAFDKDDKATTDNLYTMIYYAPKGDDGEVYFMDDGFYEAKDNYEGMYNFKVSENGLATYTFKPTDFFEENEITDKAYVWVKISDGVNGLDLYSDDLSKEVQGEIIAREEAGSAAKTQVVGDTLKVTKASNGKTFSIEGLENMTGTQKLTLNAGVKLSSEAFKNIDMTKVTVSENGEASTVKPKKLLKVKKKKGIITVKPLKTTNTYTLTIPLNEDQCTLVLNVVNIGFDKALKKKKITAKTGEGSVVSANLVKFTGKKASEEASDFLSAEWYIDKKLFDKNPGETIDSKAGFKVTLSKDNRKITIANPGDKTKGSVKIMVKINGKKYSTVIKAKVPKDK